MPQAEKSDHFGNRGLVMSGFIGLRIGSKRKFFEHGDLQVSENRQMFANSL
jgi:hypothetical protein